LPTAIVEPLCKFAKYIIHLCKPHNFARSMVFLEILRA
jgi:hypothetical protein